MDSECSARLKSTLKKAAMILAIGLCYYIFTKLTGWGIPCPIYLLTDRYCPGCGISRMCAALLELDLGRAFRCNALIMALLPFGMVFGIRRWIIYIKTGKTDPDRPESIAIMIASILTVLFWIARNQPAFSFLAP